LAEERGLLISGNAEDGCLHAEHIASRNSELAARSTNVGQHFEWNAEDVAELAAPRACADVIQHRARRIRWIGRVDGPTREVPHEPTVDRSEREIRRLILLEQAQLAEHPFDLRRREIRIGHESAALADFLRARCELGAA
jgi:hypothetical protein